MARETFWRHTGHASVGSRAAGVGCALAHLVATDGVRGPWREQSAGAAVVRPAAACVRECVGEFPVRGFAALPWVVSLRYSLLKFWANCLLPGRLQRGSFFPRLSQNTRRMGVAQTLGPYFPKLSTLPRCFQQPQVQCLAQAPDLVPDVNRYESVSVSPPEVASVSFVSLHVASSAFGLAECRCCSILAITPKCTAYIARVHHGLKSPPWSTTATSQSYCPAPAIRYGPVPRRPLPGCRWHTDRPSIRCCRYWRDT